MASDYKRIVEEHRERYGSDTEYRSFFYEQLYSEKTHFIYELVQNAEDNNSEHLELRLGESALLAWNDGDKFSENDVRSICSIGSSNKDLTQIGTFGMGFKSVYNYTECPEIYSGDERFRIRNLTNPEGIDEIIPSIAEQLGAGRTVFHLPFTENLRQEDITRLKGRLCNLEKRVLLFLRNLKTIQWLDKRDGQSGVYASYREAHSQMQNVYEVHLTASLNGVNQLSETYLVFRKEVQPPQTVIAELLRTAKNDKDRHRIQRSAEKYQSVEVAFRLQNGSITDMGGCVLFAYLPTTIKTDLRFFTQARYQTTLARDNIQVDNPWNRWLVQETANFLPNILEQLKANELLEPSLFNVIPLKTDFVPDTFMPISDALQKAMQERPLIPTENGQYAKAEEVWYPHNELLRELFEQVTWLHPDIRDTGNFRRSFKVMREVGVKEINVELVMNHLKKWTPVSFSNQSNEWLCHLYVYLNTQRSKLDEIKRLPLIRIENGQHVCPDNHPVFFPPQTDVGREEIKPFLNDLPILRSSLLEGATWNDVAVFLKSVGVKLLHHEDIIRNAICSKYFQPEKPSIEENRWHVRYIRYLLSKVSPSDLIAEISKTPILLVYRNDQREPLCWIEPRYAYLPQTYTNDGDLETYFSGCNNVWYIDDGYLESNSERQDWCQFLKAIGATDTPRVCLNNISLNHRNLQELNERGIKREYSTGAETIEDFDFDGLREVLTKISSERAVNLSQILWHLLVKALPAELERRNVIFQGTYHWYHYSWQSKSFDATFYRQLKETAWLPDEYGNLHLPSECFAPTTENRRVLGDSVDYLSADFDISQDNDSRWLASKLGVRLNAATESVLSYLQILSDEVETNVEKIKPLYQFLAQQHARPIEQFKQNALIFARNPELYWWRTDEVFWEDESPIFGNQRGYLKAYYPETLKPFFTALEVSERAAPLDYVRGIQEIAAVGRAENPEVRKRVNALYRRLWQSLQEGGSWKETVEWQQTREGRCWLGKKGNEWGFFSRHELVWKDHDYIAEIFEGDIPFWASDDDLLALANKNLEIAGCSQAEDEFCPDGDQEEDAEWSVKVQNLRPYICDFLNSPRLCEGHQTNKSVRVLDSLSVCLVETLEIKYTLKGIPQTHPNPRQSSLDATNQKTTLWLALEASEDDYAWLIGDALQYYFGDVKELSGFVEDLLMKNQEDVLNRWKQKGLQTNFYSTLTGENSKDCEENLIKPVGDRAPEETHIGNTGSIADQSDVKTSIDIKVPGTDGEDADPETDTSDIEVLIDNEPTEINKQDDNSILDASEHLTGSQSGIEGINLPDIQLSTGTGIETVTVNETPEVDSIEVNPLVEQIECSIDEIHVSGSSQPNGHSISTSSSRGSRGGGHGGTGGGGEGSEHQELKENLAANPSQLDVGLKLLAIEYTFKSNDRVDILLEDGSENPVTVEVETGFSSGAGRYVGVWQAVKYKHLAAVEYSLPCEKVRSILAAPEIPDDVKTECEKLGIEPIEVPD